MSHQVYNPKEAPLPAHSIKSSVSEISFFAIICMTFEKGAPASFDGWRSMRSCCNICLRIKVLLNQSITIQSGHISLHRPNSKYMPILRYLHFSKKEKWLCTIIENAEKSPFWLELTSKSEIFLKSFEVQGL